MTIHRRLGSLLALCLLPLGLLAVSTDDASGAAERREGLNVIVVVVDDMDDFTCADTERYLPRSSAWLRDRGRCFENATTTSPVCCPARATIMSGQVPHNNRVKRQTDAVKLAHRRTIQTKLSRRGLTTYGVGKYLNGVAPAAVQSGSIKTGFDRTDFWHTNLYYDYVQYDQDGRPVRRDERVHTTVRAGNYLTDFVSEMVAEDETFYAYVGFAAPHTQNRKGQGFLFPEPTPANAERAVPKFTWRAEDDTTDKLLPFHSLEEGHGRRYYTRFHAARVRALYDVDDQVAATFELLQATGTLKRTAVFFVSDNGYHLGSNGWEGKAVPYPDSIRVPMLAYYPKAFGSGVIDKRRVGLVDLAPTIYDLLDVRAGYRLDGHSLLGRTSRRETFHEFTNERSKFVLQESGHAPFAIPTWASYVDVHGSQYIEYYKKNGSLLATEYYTDKGRRENLLAAEYAARRPSARKLAGMRARLKELRSCAGTVEQGSRNPCP